MGTAQSSAELSPPRETVVRALNGHTADDGHRHFMRRWGSAVRDAPYECEQHTGEQRPDRNSGNGPGASAHLDDLAAAIIRLL
jgi:hypothetical protein